jgi:hypothetical protein
MNKLQIIKHMEDYSISEIFEELGLWNLNYLIWYFNYRYFNHDF